MANSATSRMLICLWKDCNRVFEDSAAFHEHVTTNHGQQLNCDNHDHNTMEEDEPKAKKAQLDEEDREKMANQTEHEESKIVYLAIEVWVDVLGFIRRIQLANTVSLTNRRFYQICWPRMHGEKVEMHEVREITIVGREGLDICCPPKALVQKDGKAMPLPSCPPPPYISGFRQIKINILDKQVLHFLIQILPCIAAHRIKIRLCVNKPNPMQRAHVHKLLDLFREGASNIHLELNCPMASFPSLQKLDNKMQTTKFENVGERGIPLLMKMLASPRPDGQQRVICLPFLGKFAPSILYAIKKEFYAATQPVPQPFCILSRTARRDNNVGRSVKENVQSDETLIVSLGNVYGNQSWIQRCNIYRHPIGEHSKWREDARERLHFPENGHTTIIEVTIW